LGQSDDVVLGTVFHWSIHHMMILLAKKIPFAGSGRDAC
jgi:hypothetical protein